MIFTPPLGHLSDSSARPCASLERGWWHQPWVLLRTHHSVCHRIRAQRELVETDCFPRWSFCKKVTRENVISYFALLNYGRKNIHDWKGVRWGSHLGNRTRIRTAGSFYLCPCSPGILVPLWEALLDQSTLFGSVGILQLERTHSLQTQGAGVRHSGARAGSPHAGGLHFKCPTN